MASERKHPPVIAIALLRNKKKAGMAVALAVVMGIMWMRVLVGHKPQAAAAAPAPKPTAAGAAKSSVKVKYVELPVVSGRHDTIEHDFFTGRDWRGFPTSSGPGTTATDPEVVLSAADRTRENVEKMAQRVNLQAVLTTGSPQAFINDQLYHAGETFVLQDGADLYLFEVVQVGEDSVRVRCRGNEVILKMK
jgi:hypothetical protein